MHAPRSILIVDDEPAILSIVAIVLRRTGYRVLTATDPRYALAVSEDRGQTIDLLLTDVTMPEMDGPSLAGLFQRNSPCTKVLFMTGHVGRHGIPERDAILPKPFRPAQLIEAVDRTLSKTVSAGA